MLRRLCALAGLCFMVAHGAQAQAFGRVLLTVVTPDGEPIPGVEVRVTSAELPSYEENLKTNKKGRVTAAFVDATKFYLFELSHPDYAPVSTDIKPAIQQTLRREIVLGNNAVAGATAGGGEVFFTPAERTFNEGVVALRGGDRAAAMSKFAEALAIDANLAAAHSAIAGIHLEAKEYEAGLAAAERYRDLEPGSPRAYRLLYDAYQGLGRDEEAEAALAKLEELGEGIDRSALVFNQGVAAYNVGDLAVARGHFEQALELQPDLVQAVSALSNIAVQQKDWTKAAETAERHLELEPGSAKAIRIRYDAYLALGDEAKLAEAREALAALDPGVLVRELYNEGVQHFRSGEIDAAVEAFEQTLALDESHAEAHFRLGLCHVNRGESADAKEHLTRFLELSPEHPEAQTARDMLGFLG